MNPATAKHSPRSPRSAAPSHLARSGACGHQSPPATLPPWLGFRASAPAPVAMSSSSRSTCREERPGDSLAAARDKAAKKFPLPPPPLERNRKSSDDSLKQMGSNEATAQLYGGLVGKRLNTPQLRSGSSAVTPTLTLWRRVTRGGLQGLSGNTESCFQAVFATSITETPVHVYIIY